MGDVAAGSPDAATLEALSDDLNTPAAIAAMHQIDDPATLKATAALFGLLGQSAAERAAEARRGVDVGRSRPNHRPPRRPCSQELGGIRSHPR